jgi:hypothetical protein
MGRPPRRSRPAQHAASHTSAAPSRSASQPSALVERLQTYAREARIRLVAVGLILAFFVAQSLVAARTNTPTPDEFAYVPEGLYHLRTGDLSFDTTNPPLLKMAMALPLLAMDVQVDSDPHWRDNRTGWGPWIFGTHFMEVNQARYLDAFFAARLVVAALGVALTLLVFWYALTLLSPLAAIGALVLFGTMPPVLAHSALATLDVGVTVLLFAAFVVLERFAVRKAWQPAAWAGVLLGLAFAVKGVAALFFPLVPLLVAIEWRSWNRTSVQRFVAGGVAMAIGAWLAVEVAYGFSGFPLPAALIEGVRFQMAASSAGEFPAFLNGHWSQTGWWYYYLAALALKTPIPTLVLLAAGSIAVVQRRGRDRRNLWIVVPPLFLLYVLSFHYGKNYGIRYLLPAFPFLILLAGRGIDALLRLGTTGAAAVGVLLAWQVAACALATPHQLAYFNELAGGPDHGRRLLLDSNLDWGQDLGRLKAYMDANGITSTCLGYFGHVDPHLYGIDYSFPPTNPAPGRCAVSANFLAGYPYGITYAGEKILSVRKGVWSWFDRYQPVTRVGRSIYIFDVTAEDISRATGAAAGRADQ